MANIKHDIVEKIAVLSEKGDWTKEINRVSWNARPAKFDDEEYENLKDVFIIIGKNNYKIALNYFTCFK